MKKSNQVFEHPNDDEKYIYPPQTCDGLINPTLEWKLELSWALFPLGSLL